MKKLTFSILLWAGILCYLNAQTFSDQKTFSFSVDDLDLLRIHNKDGKVKVVGIDGNQATLTVKRTIKSANAKKLEAAKSTIFLDSVNLDGELMFFVESPDYQLQINDEGRAYYQSDYNNWSNKKHNFHQVKTIMQIELSVPKKMALYISTHREDLEISNINADVLAQNHHGQIELTAIAGNVQAHTHHGSIKAAITKSPNRDAWFDTHHGHIEVTYPANLSANVGLKTRHGNFFTDFDYEAKAMPVSLKKSNKGTKYKVEGGTCIQIGNNGPKLNFETYHGNIYLLK